MPAQALQLVDSTLDVYASRLPQNSLTLQAILREDKLGEIAAYARGEGLTKLACFLEEAEQLVYRSAH
jgi:hypothetical protein